MMSLVLVKVMSLPNSGWIPIDNANWGLISSTFAKRKKGKIPLPAFFICTWDLFHFFLEKQKANNNLAFFTFVYNLYISWRTDLIPSAFVREVHWRVSLMALKYSGIGEEFNHLFLQEKHPCTTCLYLQRWHSNRLTWGERNDERNPNREGASRSSTKGQDKIL